MAGLPHFRNSTAAMNKFEPVYLSQFEVIITPPPSIAAGWPLVMENILSIKGLEVNKVATTVEQKYKNATRSYSGGVPENTTIDITMDFEVNLDEQNSAYVYKSLRRWCDLVYNPLTGRMGLKRDYVGGPLIINYFNKAGDIFRQIKAPMVFPTTAISAIDTDFASNEIYKITGFTLRADYWEETII